MTFWCISLHYEYFYSIFKVDFAGNTLILLLEVLNAELSLVFEYFHYVVLVLLLNDLCTSSSTGSSSFLIIRTFCVCVGHHTRKLC